MTTIDIALLDLSVYQTPLLPADVTLQLAFDLYAARPAEAPEHVHKAAKRMYDRAERMQAALLERIKGGGFNLAAEISFDNLTDRCWSGTRRQLEWWMNFDDPALGLLDDAQQAALDLANKRQLAEVARKLDNHLFGDNGLAFLRGSLREQVVAMGVRLEFIATSDEHEAFTQVIGADRLATLQILQDRYETMVHDRSMRDDSMTNVRTLRQDLVRQINRYSGCVLSTMDEEVPGSMEAAIRALRPMANARNARSNSSSESVEGAIAASEPTPDPAPEADAAD